MRKNKDNKVVVIQKHQAERIISNSKFTFRNFVRYGIILVYSACITWLFMGIENIPNNINEVISLGWTFITIAFIVLIALISLKMNEYFLNGKLVNSVMRVVSLGFVGVMIYFLKIKAPDHIDIYSYYKLLYWLSGIVGLSMLWTLVLAIEERRTRPFFAQSAIIKLISRTCVQAGIWLFHLYAITYMPGIFTYGEGYKWDAEDKTQMMLLFGIVMMFVIAFALMVMRIIHYRRKINNGDIMHSLSLSISVIVGLPIAIWFWWTNFDFTDNWQNWSFIVAPSLAVLLMIWFSLFKRSELASPKVFNVILTLSLFIIWANKFGWEYEYPGMINQSFTISITLSANAAIATIAIIKNTPLTKTASSIYASFIVTSNLITLAEWVLTTVQLDLIHLPFDLNDLLHGTILIEVSSMLINSVARWYLIQARISRNIKFEKETKHSLAMQAKLDKKKKKKEAKNA